MSPEWLFSNPAGLGDITHIFGLWTQHLVEVTPREAARRLVREVGAALMGTAPACPPAQGLQILMPPRPSIRTRILFDVYEDL